MKLKKQVLVRMSDELYSKIDENFAKYLKKTGEYTTKSAYIRSLLEKVLK